uniref:Uncharacterized protein ycf23 n=1 Tax=Pleurostichidium falkenbergii TaxID=121064 RepID=A0A4D6UYJ5_9FLOR|nr:hypothetical protein [Pleurostichidium falkenbergii]QCH39614.1 hypothetical protein [Pleurostichidium falkenbergii]
MNLSNIQLSNSFKSKTVVKVITGINNTNSCQILKIAKAANLANATYLDVVANPRIIKLLKICSSLPLCVSSIDPMDIYNSVVAGADLIEIGNYDVLYRHGIYITSTELKILIKEIKLLVGNIDICVTIPYHLDLVEQINLAQDLQNLRVNILQTEGFFIKNALKNLSSLTDSLSASLLSTYCISNNVDIPLIASSKVTSIFAPMAIYFGASGVGIGSTVSEKSSVIDMVNYINEVKNSISIYNFTHDSKLSNTEISFFGVSAFNKEQ